MAVDARSRVPTAVRLFAIVDLNQHLIIKFVLIQIRGHVDGKRRIAIGMLTCLLAIDEYFGLLVNTLEMEFDQLSD